MPTLARSHSQYIMDTRRFFMGKKRLSLKLKQWNKRSAEPGKHGAFLSRPTTT